MNEQACDFCGGAGSPRARLRYPFPSSAEAGWRRGGHWGPGVNVYVGPRWGWYGPRARYWGGRYAYGYPYAYYPYWRGRYWRGWY